MKRLLTFMVMLASLAGCGVQPTGVLDGGAPSSGIPEGIRLYFVSDNGLRGVARPGLELSSLEQALNLLRLGPLKAEVALGLSNDFFVPGPYRIARAGSELTVTLPNVGVSLFTGSRAGQVVCTLSRAEILLHGSTTDAVRVTIAGSDGSVGPYECAQFLRS
ncbi:hypothetical protein AB5J62_17895 [Amycolatopsis sp. cg5]|uniref:hypothetical protein n=1 Tax=Amycolatopsis sp. cg5 TaxID=3238802 RepID=UPI003524DDA0